MIKFTILTPTYNRAYLLKNLYESLKKQTYKNFEWLIIDDGSTDNTQAIIKTFSNENRLNIRYFKKENGGKHTAINLGLNKALGELFFIVDSDDVLTSDSLEILNKKSVKLNDEIVGLVGMRGYISSSNSMVKKFNLNELIASSLEFTYKYNFNEETAICVRTTIAKKYPFPEYNNEKFCPESLLWNRISKNYKFYYFNQIIYLGDYLENGLTDNYGNNIKKFYKTSTIYYKELLNYKIVPSNVKLSATKILFTLSRKTNNRLLYIIKNIPIKFILKYALSKI
ncbi:glycosyltransferase family 2 protein [Empedobacter falsenii]